MQAPSRKTLTFLLVGSLLLNLFLAGLITSHVWHARSFGPSGGPGGSYSQKSGWRNLPEEQRTLFRKIWREHKDEIKTGFQEMRGIHERLRENLAGKVERDEFEAAYRDFFNEQTTAQNKMFERLLDITMTLPPEQRSQFLSLWGMGQHRHRSGHKPAPEPVTE
ncbi:periplasmic heavy metal sensor [Kiloniella laminariae]|uniref:Periplasmic heavy metal sensor n=1 Tax=Kiloniella laminariae TaxID=454162 RepID=A0ABT4LMT9_9PROT|nr:periplasmic heavy metal sensor [Kiloniella laminariae]MCZ4282431.1 periplasmic heavy metal sensor [Kiloniella laminariae]